MLAHRTRVKELLRAHRRGDREAIARVAQHVGDRDRLQLADARLVIAREAGLASWPRLERHITRPPPQVRRCPRLHAAVHAGDLAAVHAAFADDTFSPWQTREAIEAAIARDDRAIVRVLLDHGGWVDTAGRAFGRWGGGLHAALLLGRDVAMIEELLAGGASIAARDRDGRTPLAIAVRTHHPGEIVLRRAGATDDETDAIDRMLGACIAGGHPARTALPLRRSDHQHLAWALRRGHAAALPALLAVGLDPDVPDDDGETPLHLACTRGAIDALLAAGARPDALDFFGERPDGTSDPVDDRMFEAAVEAIIAGRIDELRALLDRDPRLVTARSRRDHRATLLHYVGANGVEDARQKSPREAPAIATLLVARGADPDALALTYGGGPAQTALYLAATSSNPADAGIMVPLIEALVAARLRRHAARDAALAIEHDRRDRPHAAALLALLAPAT